MLRRGIIPVGDSMDTTKVVVVGAGLAGLACAHELEARGLGCTLLERDQRIGGRVQTDVVDGFRLDRGFQVLLTAYPETRRLLDTASLQLRPFFPGAIIRSRGKFVLLADPWRRPLAAVRSLVDGTVSVADGLRMARFRSRVRRGPRKATGSGELSSLERLHAEGFSRSLIDGFFRPFFGGVFLDAELATSERQMEFVFRMFSAGDIAVPAAGMGEIPSQLADRLERSRIRTGTAVKGIDERGVLVAGGGRLDADAVVVATDAVGAAELVPTIEHRDWLGVTCLYYSAPEPPLRGPYLVLNGEDDGPINNLGVMSEVAGEMAAGGQSLVSVTVLGARDVGGLEDAVFAQLQAWFGLRVRQWRHLETYRIDRALPEQSPPMVGARSPSLRKGLYVCGDHWHDASINGALASGRRAAEAVIGDFREGRR